jgi:hypothetical protein
MGRGRRPSLPNALLYSSRGLTAFAPPPAAFAAACARALTWALRRLRLSRSAALRRSARFWSPDLLTGGRDKRPPRGRQASPRQRGPYRIFASRKRCRSSVVEHPLGKGEVVSSILTGSTIKINDSQSATTALWLTSKINRSVTTAAFQRRPQNTYHSEVAEFSLDRMPTQTEAKTLRDQLGFKKRPQRVDGTRKMAS